MGAGRAAPFTSLSRSAASNDLVRLPISGGKPEYVVKDTGSVGGWSVGKYGSVGVRLRIATRARRNSISKRAAARRASSRT